MTMEDNMKAIGKRFSALSDYNVEVDDKGRIQKLNHHYIQDVGCSINEPGLSMTDLDRFDINFIFKIYSAVQYLVVY